MRKLSYCWQSWGPDANILLESIGAALDLGADPRACSVWEHNWKPFNAAARAWILDRGIHIEESTYEKNKSLDDFCERLRVMRETAGRADSEYVIRIDSDTVVGNAEQINKGIEDGIAIMGAAWVGSGIAGCASLHSVEALDLMLGLCKKFKHDLKGSMKGDELLDYIALRWFPSTTRRLWFNPDGGYLKGWQFNRDDPAEYARSYNVVSFGKHLACGGIRIINSVKNCDRHEQVGIAMRKFRNELPSVLGRQPFPN